MAVPFAKKEGDRTMNARATLTVTMLITTLLGSATIAAALPPIVTWSFATCGHSPVLTASNLTAGFTPDDPVSNDDCFALCDKFVTACKGAVNASVACWKGATKKFAALQTAVCNLESDAAAVDACKDVLAADKALVKESYIDLGQENGHSYCETTALFSCNIDCN
jgi:hypothetical protein